MIKYILGLMCLVILQLPLFADTNIQFKTSYLEDVNSEWNIDQVKRKNFTDLPNQVGSFGITKSTYWIKISLDDISDIDQGILDINRAFLDEIIIYYDYDNISNFTDTLGIKTPVSKQNINYYLPAFKIPLKTLTSNHIYLRVKSKWSMLVPIKIRSEIDFDKDKIYEYLLAGLLIGGLFVMAIYNFFLFFSTRDVSYIIYVVGLIGAIFSQGYIFGILIPIVSPENPEFSFRFPIIAMAITGLFNCWFALKFLEIKQSSKLFYYLLLFGIAVGISSITLEISIYLFDLHSLDYLSRKLNILEVLGLSLIIFSSAVQSLIKGKKVALYFTIAWTFYLFGMFTFALKTVGVIPHNVFTEHFMHFGTFLECMLLSFALGHKYSLVRVEKERLENQTRKELEILVKQQTEKLEISLEEKEILLKEIHHRVKNNLQIVISLLDLQVASIQDSANKEILAQSKSRVYSMSLIHQKLYQSDNLARINMHDYLDELFAFVKNSYFSPSVKLLFGFDVHSKELSITNAVPLGLIVNELLTNSFKYGINEDDNNKISLSLHFLEDTIVLKVIDSGVGFKKQDDHQNVKKSLGLFLVKSLTKQLRGELSRSQTEQGFTTRIEIPKEVNYEK